MRQTMFRILALALLATGSAAAAAPNVAGDWVIQDKSAVITLAPCGSRMCGRISKALIRKPGYPQADVHNPNAALRKRPLLGLQILSGFVPKADRWDGGRIYDPESGNSYRSVLKLNADGSLKVSGCIVVFCRSQRWTRVR
jgi:uncharacterized protein (DUF2147 family)